MSFLNIPTFGTKLVDDEITSKSWYFFFQGLWKGQPPSSEVAVALTGSSFTYPAPSRGFVVVNGGTVSVISISRDNTTYYTTGETAGVFPISMGDYLRVTYTVAPTVTFFPQ